MMVTHLDHFVLPIGEEWASHPTRRNTNGITVRFEPLQIGLVCIGGHATLLIHRGFFAFEVAPVMHHHVTVGATGKSCPPTARLVVHTLGIFVAVEPQNLPLVAIGNVGGRSRNTTQTTGGFGQHLPRLAVGDSALLGATVPASPHLAAKLLFHDEILGGMATGYFVAGIQLQGQRDGLGDGLLPRDRPGELLELHHDVHLPGAAAARAVGCSPA